MAWKERLRSALPVSDEDRTRAVKRADMITTEWPVEDRDMVYRMLGLDT